MGTTASYGLPYPEATDLVINGDDAIQALAEATEAAFHASICKADVVGPDPIVPGGAGLDFGTLTATASFSEVSAGVIAYTGATRWHHVNARVSATTISTDFNLSLGVWHNGVAVAGHVSRSFPATLQFANTVVSTLLLLQDGDTLQLYADPTDTVTTVNGTLDVFSISPGVVL